MRWSYRIPAIILSVIIVLLGVQPSWVVRWTEATTTAMLTNVPAIAQVVSWEDFKPSE